MSDPRSVADYERLIDAETWGFIRATGDSYPDDAVGLDIAGQRRVYDTMCRAFHQDYPAGVTLPLRSRILRGGGWRACWGRGFGPMAKG